MHSRLIDPFPAGPDIRAYVPSSAVEQVLSYLAAKLEERAGWVGICGAPGVGKTLVLRLLLRRHGATATPVYIPDASFTPSEIARWIAAELGSARGESLEAIARRLRAQGRPLLLGIDEAQSASAESMALLDTLSQPEMAARAVLAWSELEGAPIPRALVGCRARVFLEPLELAVVPQFVETQLGRVNADPALRAALAGRTLERIALASAGNQRQIQRLADAELAAHAWRTRPALPRRSEPALERATTSAPRGTIESPALLPDSGISRWRNLLLGTAALIGFLAAVLGFSR